MFSSEKWAIRLHNFFRNLMFYWVFWLFGLELFIFLTGNDDFFLQYFNRWQHSSLHLVTGQLALGISLLFSGIDLFFGYRISRITPLKIILFVRSLLYLASVFILLLCSLKIPGELIIQAQPEEIAQLLPPTDLPLYQFLVYYYLTSFGVNLGKQMVRKIGRGNIRIWLLGLLNKPMEQQRIFMFIDMKSSTTLAEKLGHKKFSHLVQDVFNDMAVVDNYAGEIYQYLGDGAIISWSMKAGLNNNNFLKAFFAFTRTVQRRKRYYKRKYDIEPAFKAGAHVGKVMVLQVGNIRKDISYNGDTINTTARIESMCNEFRQQLIISGDLYKLANESNDYAFKILEKTKLKGKKKAIELVQVKPRK